nr:MAG TPA: hypothetical protein [Microviridae sp.]
MNYRTRIIYGSQSENVAHVNERPDYVNNQPNQVDELSNTNNIRFSV